MLDVVAWATRGGAQASAGACWWGAGVACALGVAGSGQARAGRAPLGGHLLSPFLSADPAFFVACWCRAATPSSCVGGWRGALRNFGETIDDAAGEAFDKSAKLMGLGYPAGPPCRAWRAG